MRYLIGLTLAGTILVPALAPVGAQDERVLASARIPAAAGSCCRVVRKPADETRVATKLAEGTALAEAGQMAEAGRVLRAVIREQRRLQMYPADALRQLANVELALDRPLVAAATLEQLASAAAAASDPERELLALVDAAITYAQAGKRDRQHQLMPRITVLLDSPGIAEPTRRDIARHIPE